MDAEQSSRPEPGNDPAQAASVSFEGADLRWFMVAGAPRSGTTLLALLLNTHPEVGCLREIALEEFIGNIDRLFGAQRAREDVTHQIAVRTEQKAAERAMMAALPPDPGTTPAGGPGTGAAFGPSPKQAAAQKFHHQRDYDLESTYFGPAQGLLTFHMHSTKVARALAEIALGKSGLRRVGTKVPNTDVVATSRLFAQRLPNMRFVQIVRRPTDVVNSSLGRRNNAARGRDVWHISNVQEACKEWMANWNMSVAAQEQLGDRLLTVKYEDLATQADLLGTLLAGHLQVDNRFDFSIVEILPASLERYAMTQEEVEFTEACFQEVERAWNEPVPDLFSRFPRLGWPLDESGLIRFGLGGNSEAYQSGGFLAAETWGCWTEGRQGRLDISLPDVAGDILLELHFLAWRVEPDKPFEFIVAAGSSQQLITLNIPVERNVFRRSILVPRAALPNPRLLTLRFIVLTPKTPADPPLDDPRNLGVGLSTLRVSFLEV